MLRRWVLLSAVLLAAQVAWCQPLQVPRVEQAPVIDGQLGDACWAQATVLDDFHVLGGGQQPVVATTARLCHDGAWLYLAFDCADPEPSRLVAQCYKRDGPVSFDDSVEVFISPRQTGDVYYHFLLSVTNTHAEQEGRREGIPNRLWDTGWLSATKVGVGGWSAEMALPLAALGSSGGEHWLLNLCRNKRTAPEQYLSLAPVQSQFREVEHFLPLARLPVERAPFAPCLRRARVSQYLTRAGRLGYELTVQASNITGQGGEIALTVTDRPPFDAPGSVRASFRLDPVGQRDLTVFVPVTVPQRREVTVVMSDPDSGEERQRLTVADTTPLQPLHAYLDRSYYTREAAAQVVCTLQVPREELDGWRVVVQDEGGQVVAQAGDLHAREVALAVPLGPLPLGERALTAQLRDPQGRVVGEQALELRKLSPAAHEVKIDRVRQVLLRDGQPYLPIGFLRVPGADVPEHAAHGMTSCSSFALPWAGRQVEISDTLQAATQHGLSCVEYLPRLLSTPEGRLVAGSPQLPEHMRWAVENLLPGILALARDQEALIAYYSIDEPTTDAQFDACLQLYRGVRAHDPYHPVYLLFSDWIPDNQDWTQAMDIVGVDPYMIMGHPTQQGQRYTLQHMAASTSAARQVADRMHSALWIIPHGECYSGSVRPLLPDEQRCQTWMALIYGGRGLLWFRNPVYHQASWDNFGALVADLKQLVPALLERQPAQEVSVLPATAVRYDFPIVHARVLAEPGGGTLVLAANSEPREVTARFALAGLPAHAAVQPLFAAPAPARAGDSFTDTLQRYGTRAWRISGWQPPEGEVIRLTVTVSGPALEALTPGTSAHPMPPAERNLIAHGDLESLDTWELSPGGGAGNAPAQISFPDSPETGGKAVRIERDNDFANACIISKQWLQLKPHTRYRYGLQIKGDLTCGRGRFTMMLVDATGHGLGWPAAALNSSSEQWVSVVREAATDDDPPAVRVWLSQYRAGGVAWFDNVFLEELGPVTRSRNLLLNSSFEHEVLPGWPDLWWPDGPVRPRIGAPGAAWGTTEEDAWHGRRCLKIVRPGSADGRVYSTLNHSPRSVAGQVYTLSLYARADRPGRKLRMQLGPATQVVELSDQWQRYGMSNQLRGSYDRGRSEPLWTSLYCLDGEGVYYLDAVQIEAGEQSSEYAEDDWPGATP